MVLRHGFTPSFLSHGLSRALKERPNGKAWFLKLFLRPCLKYEGLVFYMIFKQDLKRP
jgi:hypothetical protein